MTKKRLILTIDIPTEDGSQGVVSKQPMTPLFSSIQPPKTYLFLWLLCFALFFASCTEARLFSPFGYDRYRHPPHPFARRGYNHPGMPPYRTRSPPSPPRPEPNIVPDGRASNVFQPAGAVRPKIEEGLSVKSQEPAVEEIKSSAEQADVDTRKERRKVNSAPELIMTDKERRKREEMDKSSDELIIALSAEQSDEEKIQMMRQLREMQKHDIVIEV